MMRTLPEVLCAEMRNRNKNGIYHRMQIDFAYNSNHIEGSRLTHEQTKYIFDTKTIGVGTGKSEEAIMVNDIIETVNHFRCFDYILQTVSEPLTEDYIKKLHETLKNGIFSNDSDAVIGDYKKFPNEVGDEITVLPEEVPERIRKLIEKYNQKSILTLYDIAAFHAEYESIHPFYDGNGRTGRLLMMKQCLANDIVPFYIDDFNKMFYYMGLKEWRNGKNERLIQVFLSAQDDMESILKYFRIDYDRGEMTYEDVMMCADE